VLFPEYLTCEDRSGEIAAHVVEWLTHPGRYQRRVEQLKALRESVAMPGASRRSAAYILQEANQAKIAQVVPRPHFQMGMPLESDGGWLPQAESQKTGE
jgi:hypothetical protein